MTRTSYRGAWIVAFTLSASELGAQTLPGTGMPRPSDPYCQTALAAVQVAPITISADSLGALISRVGPCSPELGRAAGSAIRSFAGSGSAAHAAVAFSVTPPFIDSAVFAAARDIAPLSTSAEVMRLSALKALYYILDRGEVPTLASFQSNVRGSVTCSLPPASDIPRTDIFGDYTPLPATYLTEARNVAVAIQQDVIASPALQSASYCVLEAWRRRSGLPGNAHWPFAQDSLVVDYVCGNRFRLRNFHPVEIALEWTVGNLPNRRIVLAVPVAGQTYSERVLDGGTAGDLKLFLDGALFKTRANGGTPCP